ncbi:MAG: thiamine pyrophosphate-dependent dehydrogenase E1 component subunit alpha [Gammaproteobacteria bacterium]
MQNSIKDLIDSTKFDYPLLIDNIDNKILTKMLKSMIVIRKTEKKLAEGRKEGLIGGPVHLGAGQEAIAVGISESLQRSDRVFGAHRSHSHLLALNPNFHKLFAEVLGKETGFSKGMGGSMHLFDQENGFYGSVPIVSGTVSLAVGAAMAAKMQKTNDIGVAYIGDGAVEEGVVHESLNLAKLYDAPMLFVVENNLFASHMHLSLRQPNNMTSRFAIANEIPYLLLDGNDVCTIYNSAKEQISEIRNGAGPRFIELITYRHYGHVDWRDDIDVGVERSLDDVKNWKARDPILRLSNAMIEAKIWSTDEEDSYINELDIEIKSAWDTAMNDPYPDKKATLEYVYSNNKSGNQ